MLRVDILGLVCACGLLAACETMMSSPPSVASDVRQPTDLANCDANTGPDRMMETDMVVNLIDQDRFHAALARLDALPQETAYTRYLRAHALRQLNRNDEAETLFMELLPSCMEGYARHGLGLLAAQGGAIATAREHLAGARQRLPLDPRVRNDYGYVLLLAEEPVQAYSEFMTALELNTKARQPKFNTLLTLLLLEREDQARHFAERMELSQDDVEQAMQEARRINRGWLRSTQSSTSEAVEGKDVRNPALEDEAV